MNLNYRGMIVTILLMGLFIFVNPLKANSPMCEVYNLDTDKCELFTEQDIELDEEWNTFEFRPDAWTQKELKIYMKVLKDSK